MQGAGAISETILVCKLFFRTLLGGAKLAAKYIYRRARSVKKCSPAISIKRLLRVVGDQPGDREIVRDFRENLVQASGRSRG